MGEEDHVAMDQVTLQRALRVLPVCFGLLEKAVHGLCAEDDNEEAKDDSTEIQSVWTSMSSEQLLKLRDCLVNAIKDIIAFIKYVASEPPAFYEQCQQTTSLLYQEAQTRMTSLENVIGACLRTVSLWLIVDVDSIEMEITEIIRDVLCCPSKPGFHLDSIEYFIGPGLVQLLHSDSVRMELYDCKGHLTLLKQLKKYLKDMKRSSSSVSPVQSTDSLEQMIVVEQRIESLIAATVSVLQTCTVLIVQYGSVDAYLFDAVGIFVPKFRKLLNGALMQEVVAQVIQPRLIMSENAKYLMQLVKGLSWSAAA